MPFEKTQDSLQELGYLLAEGSRNVVFVIGAGLSVPAGIPNWNNLLQFLLAAVIKEIESREKDGSARSELLEKVHSFKDPWLLGDEIARQLPRARYIDLIRSKLTSGCIPPAYEAIWALSPSGVVSFNLDQLAEKSMDGTVDQVASAHEVAKYPRFLLLSRKSFLFQPHGRLAIPESWVLGATARNNLLKANRHYRHFISSMLASRRVVIVGFGPKDFAFESLLLDDFREPLSESAGHFWITPTLSAENHEWAKLYNINAIEYDPATDHHEEVFDILQCLRSFKPRYIQAPLAYDGLAIDYKDLPSDSDLRAEPVDQIRVKLNAALAGMLGTSGMSHEEELSFLRQFHDEYSGSVHMAWHILPGREYGRFWGCKILEKIGGGAFATVWRVQDPVDGTIMALKILREETLADFAFMESFRRGVSAMKILREHGVEGMVKFERAYDIPASILMEYIQGETLGASRRNSPIRAST